MDDINRFAWLNFVIIFHLPPCLVCRLYYMIPHAYMAGTFMNVDTHNKYFRDIDYNRATSISWSGASDSADNNGSSNSNGDVNKGIPYYISAAQSVYEARIQELISKCIHVRTVPQLMSEKGRSSCGGPRDRLCANSRESPESAVQSFLALRGFLVYAYQSNVGLSMITEYVRGDAP